MKLLIGLGNPGRKYSATRHNVGFVVADMVAEEFEIAVSKKKFSSFFGIGSVGNEDVCIVKPQTFMNLSGEAVRDFAGYYKLDAADILIVRDDIDSAFGKIRLVNRSGDGGHNGVASVIENLGTKDFWQLKVGIGRPPEGVDPADHVLKRFSDTEKKDVKKVLETASLAAETFFTEGPDSAMQKYNGSLVFA